MKRSDVLKVLQNHGWQPDQQTSYNPITKEMFKEGSSFDEMLGIKEEYKAIDVYKWLGY